MDPADIRSLKRANCSRHLKQKRQLVAGHRPDVGRSRTRIATDPGQTSRPSGSNAMPKRFVDRSELGGVEGVRRSGSGSSSGSDEQGTKVFEFGDEEHGLGRRAAVIRVKGAGG